MYVNTTVLYIERVVCMATKQANSSVVKSKYFFVHCFKVKRQSNDW